MAKTKSSAAHTNGGTPKVRLSQVSGRFIQMWYICPETGKKVRQSTGTRNPAEAEEVRADLEAKLRLGITQIKRSKVPGEHMPWAEFRWEYTHARLSTLKAESAVHAESRLDLAERIIKPKRLRDMANSDALERLQNKLLEGAESRKGNKPRSTATVFSHMRSVYAALNWAKKKEWLTEVPQIDLVQVEQTMKGRPLVGEEVDRILAATADIAGELAAPSWIYLIRGLVASGLRLSELMNLSWDIQQTIRPDWRRGRLPTLWFPAYRQKRKRTEDIPLVPWFDELLQETPEGNRTGWVFEPVSLTVNQKQKTYTERLTTTHVGRVISRVGKAAGVIVDEGDPRTGRGVKYASAHDLRRTFAVRLKRSGMPPDLIQQLMRHADFRTTEKYYPCDTIQEDAGRIREILTHTPGVSTALGHTPGHTYS